MAARIRPFEPRDLATARRILAAGCAFDPATQVAEEKLTRPGSHGGELISLIAELDGHPVGLAAACGAYLRLLCVHPDQRRQGVGDQLLIACEEAAYGAGATSLRTLAEPGNYLAPGIDVRNRATITWLEGRGYRQCHSNENLLIDVAGNPRVSAERSGELATRCQRAGYRVARLEASELAAVSSAIADEFSAGWAFEVGRAATTDPPSVHLAWSADGALASFAAHDGNNQGLGWFGPTGTMDAHRGQGLAAALLMACLVDVGAAGHEQCQVAWIGPRAFYEKVAGVAGHRQFVVLDKELSGR